VVTGFNSTVVRELDTLLSFTEHDEEVVRLNPGVTNTTAERYLFAAGYLAGKSPKEISGVEAADTLSVNALWPISEINRILCLNPVARICVIGSESAYTGSYDMDYARSKKMLHDFVENRRLHSPDQQLVGIAPTIIEDSGMTKRRKDLDNLAAKRKAHPKHRFLTAMEVARMVYFLLYEDRGFISNVVIRMNGGGHLW